MKELARNIQASERSNFADIGLILADVHFRALFLYFSSLDLSLNEQKRSCSIVLSFMTASDSLQVTLASLSSYARHVRQ